MMKTVGFALTGSFCTLEKSLQIMEKMSQSYRLIPILSERVTQTDTRFFKAREVTERVSALCKRPPITTITEAEPLGPKGLLDLLVICPCTGNTLSKLAHGITDTSVTMAAKSHRRSGGKVLLALSTNDALSGSAKSLGLLLDQKNYLFVPLYQDDPDQKPAGLSCRFDQVTHCVAAALAGEPLPPLFS